MLRKLTNKKAFTLIELIVVMAVIGILVLLAMPKFVGYTQKTKHTKLISNTKNLETASERYYMDYKEWPRLSDEPYTADEIKAFAERIYNITGEEVVLDAEGNYYDIDYDVLTKYISTPDDKENYIIQNPVGNVYALERLTQEGKERVDYDSGLDGKNDGSLNKKIIKKLRYDDKTEIVLKGLSPEAFDNNLSTYHTGTGTITWEGDLTHKTLDITAKGAYNGYGYSVYITFYDNAGNSINPVGVNSDKLTVATGNASRSYQTTKVIVPEGATKMEFTTNNDNPNSASVHEIKVSNGERPKDINITSTSTPYSIELSWEEFQHAIIYKNGVLLANVNGQSYTDKPLYSNTEHVYDIIIMNSEGNGQQITYKESTVKDIAVFRGLSPQVFDNDLSTFHTGLGTVTWEGDLVNKEVAITAKGAYNGYGFSVYVTFYNDEGIAINSPITVARGNSARSYQTTKVIVPEGATKMEFTTNNANPNSASVHEIKVTP